MNNGNNSRWDFLNDSTIAVALIVCIGSLATIVIVSGAASVGATGLRDLALLLGGALAGTKVPR